MAWEVEDMAATCRDWWRNCVFEADSEICEIDALEDRLGSVDPATAEIRELISSLEVCHHKAERWIENIIKAIGAGHSDKGLGTRGPGRFHPAEKVWQGVCAVLSDWCAGCSSASARATVDSVPALDFLARLGARSALKEWQVQRVIDRVRNLVHWPASNDDPGAQYTWLLLTDEGGYRQGCPERYKEHEDFWLATVRTILHDTHNGQDAELSLGIAIDMLWPCHWDFVNNLQTVLDAIGGRLTAERPFAACGRNISLLPTRDRMEAACRILNVFWRNLPADEDTRDEAWGLFGDSTDAKRWLAASLDKTIRLQLDPPDAMRQAAALAGPDWIR